HHGLPPGDLEHGIEYVVGDTDVFVQQPRTHVVGAQVGSGVAVGQQITDQVLQTPDRGQSTNTRVPQPRRTHRRPPGGQNDQDQHQGQERVEHHQHGADGDDVDHTGDDVHGLGDEVVGFADAAVTGA